MDRVTLNLTRFARWVKSSMFPRKRERSRESSEIECKELNEDSLHQHHSKRRRNTNCSATNLTNGYLYTHPSQSVLRVEIPPRQDSSRPIQLTRSQPSQGERSELVKNSNPHRFGRSRPICKASTSRDGSVSGSKPPIVFSNGAPSSSKRLPESIPRAFHNRSPKRKLTMKKMEVLKIIEESENSFTRAKMHLEELERPSGGVEKRKVARVQQLGTVKRRELWRWSPISIPSLMDLPPPVIFNTKENQTPFADQKLLDFAQRRLLLPGKAQDGQTQKQKKREFRIEMLTEEDRAFYESIKTAVSGRGFFELDNCRYETHDLQTLLPGQWLNDNIINGYMKLLQLRDQEQKTGVSCHFCKTFLVNKLFPKYQYGDARRWTLEKKLKNWGQKRKSILDCDLVFFPIHLEVHWVLVVADLITKTIKYYDSLASHMKPDLQPLLANIARYLVDEMQDKKGVEWRVEDFSLEFIKDSPRQDNGSDCGVFVARNAKELSSGNQQLHYSSIEMPEYRILMLKELSTGRIL